MKKTFLTILLFTALLSAGCSKSNEPTSEPSSLDVFGLTDETEDAAKIIREINENQLKQITGIYKNSQEQFEELKTAMKNNETDTVKKLAGELADKIDEGMNLGKESIEKIEDAQKLKINSTYREYLSLKESSMKKELTAFEFRFEAAKFLRDNFGTKDKQQIEKAKAVLKESDESFQKYMQEARDDSVEANKLYKDSMTKKSE
jgi:hypothetical protein